MDTVKHIKRNYFIMSENTLNEQDLLNFIAKIEKFECVIDSYPIDTAQDLKNRFFDLQLDDPEFKEIKEIKEIKEKGIDEIFNNW